MLSLWLCPASPPSLFIVTFLSVVFVFCFCFGCFSFLPQESDRSHWNPVSDWNKTIGQSHEHREKSARKKRPIALALVIAKNELPDNTSVRNDITEHFSIYLAVFLPILTRSFDCFYVKNDQFNFARNAGQTNAHTGNQSVERLGKNYQIKEKYPTHVVLAWSLG